MSLYPFQTYELTQTDGTYTYFPYIPGDINSTDLFITDSLDAATSSLQLGTDPLETQVIEIGSAGVTTTVYGAVNFLHPINVLSATVTNDLNVGGKTTLANVSATELTSTGIDASILKTTTLNATGTSTLGPLYAGNCSLLNVSAARVDLNTLTAVNCSVSNVSVSRLDANTLTANNVSTTNLTVVNVLTSIPIHTGFTNVAETVGTSIPVTFSSVTLNGTAAQTGGFYTYTSTNSPGYNMITGKLNLAPVFAQTTYRVCISVNALNNPVDLSFQDDVSTLFTIGTIATTPRKKYLFYLKPTVTGRLYLTISRAALSGAAEIQYDFLSVDAWYETNLTTVNATGSALLASSGGQVGVGTTTPQYTLDVSGTMRVTGVAIFDNLTLQNLSIQDFTTTNLTAPLVSTTQTIGSNITTGSISIAGGMTTSGTVNIGNAMTTSTGGINIGTALTTGSVNIGSATGTTNLRGTVLANTLNTINTTDALAIGTGNTGGITIGGSSTTVTMTGSNIKQVVPLVGGGQIENTVGNTTVSSSMSTTFNRKLIIPAGGAIACYTITSNTNNQYTNQYFELVVSGANGSRGGYTYKGCFGVEKMGSSSITQSSVSTLFYYGAGVIPPSTTVIPVITFSVTGQVLTLLVNTSGGGSADQNFVTTLTTYPTATILDPAGSVLQDFIITAI